MNAKVVSALNPDGKSFQKRWYDQQQTVSNSVILLKRLPIEFQIILSESMIGLAKSQNTHNQLDSLGPEKTLNLFKAKSKHRAYDHHAEIHQALNDLYILPEGYRIYVANRTLTLGGYLQDYLNICKKEQMQPSPNIARQVSHSFLQGHLNDPTIFLTLIRKQIQLSTHYSFQSVSQASMENLDPGPNQQSYGMIVRRNIPD